MFATKSSAGPLVCARPLLDPFVQGKYLFASRDFVAFATNFPIAHAIIGSLCALKSAALTICVRATDEATVRDFTEQFYGNAEVRLLPEDTALLLGQIIRVDRAGKARLYTAYDFGFAFLNSTEAIGIGSALFEMSAAAA